MRQNKNIDGVHKFFKAPNVKSVTLPYTPKPSPKRRLFNKRSTIFILITMFLSFGGGMYTMWYSKPLVATSDLSSPPLKPISAGPSVQSTAANLEIFANTSLKLLNAWQTAYPQDNYVERKQKLRAYLITKNSPFAKDSATVDAFLQSPHMKLMLAISFAESTLGKQCLFNNCSGIGGYEPNFRKYKKVQHWVLDFNRLLEQKYKNWTLQEMCGVYVQPCNPNWLLAAHQVLGELNELGIN